MRKLELDLAERSYNIYIEHGLIKSRDILSQYCRGENVLILSNETIGPLYADKITSHLTNHKLHQLFLPDGETHKNLNCFSQVLDFLIEHKFRRNDTLITLGGGVIGDLGGFAAASYQRGMDFIQIPTSLLAQVDSSVGGKTGINHPQGKNMIGAFYQPKAVLIDTETLATLPEKEYYSGFAEILKYAMLGSQEIEQILLERPDAIVARDQETLSELIYYSCLQKAQIVAADEREQGQRALLNLGHTFGHAIEKATAYKSYLHGEAVAIGIAMAINLAQSKNMIQSSTADKFKRLIAGLKLPLSTDKVAVEEIVEAMRLDKKNLSNKFRLILPTDSNCVIVEEDNLGLISEAIKKQLD